MSDHPIIFSGPMVRSLLDGRKTQTRRVLKPQPQGEQPKNWTRANDKAVRYAPGDRLYVREAINKVSTPGDVVYRADFEAGGNDGAGLGWRPSIHMPRWASRLTLTVTDVRVQRLQDISEEDARAEGCDVHEEARPLGDFAANLLGRRAGRREIMENRGAIQPSRGSVSPRAMGEG